MVTDKKRCGVFVIYSESYILEKYVVKLLESVSSLFDRIFIVINGGMDARGLRELHAFTDDIIVRDNAGFDGAAYQFVFQNYLDQDEVKKYDELVLFNDTFFGPFYSLDTVFADMEDSKHDFWGLTQHYGGMDSFWNREIPPHIQSYFIVIRKKLLHDKNFYDFWETMDNISDFTDAVFNFEVAFSSYFADLGYSFGAWVDNKEKNRTLYAPDILLMDKHLPILKRKFFTLTNYYANKKVINFLKDKYHYDEELIAEDIRERCRTNRMKPFNAFEVLELANRSKNVYLLGHGVYGNNIAGFLNDNGIEVMFVVSDEYDKKNGEKRLSAFEIQDDDLLIISVSKQNFENVSTFVNSLKLGCNIIFPCF